VDLQTWRHPMDSPDSPGPSPRQNWPPKPVSSRPKTG
jgi:hypothetical protein